MSIYPIADLCRSAGGGSRQLPVNLRRVASAANCGGAQHLVIRGADINAADYGSRTPLHPEATDGRIEVVRVALDLGANSTESRPQGAHATGRFPA